MPFAEDIEDLLQLTGIDGGVALHYRDAGFRARLSVSSSGTAIAAARPIPGGGRHVALGVEPVASAFDLGPAVSTAANPLARAGTPTALAFAPDRPFLTRYRLSAEPAPTG
ncbi:hypothetical protein JQ506_23945 (plasmid) [Shinella sp. PSBB067]|uniref:hypothetical protein n=1 Tax=Shinella sp. PSBB067 TaxID=2715959 RepID=UPI00193C7FEE|nr:hypothetical protein [Shinella sp. PSBB067]QRI66413.1 hypothetical protein JQ506_23945 [Shinella sp. PSBB067]